MAGLSLSTSDIVHHVVTFGIDVYPPIEVSKERTRLNMFYEAACEQWPEIYEKLTVGDTEFRMSKNFRRDPRIAGSSVLFDTFVLTNRGPVFVFPLVLPPPAEATGLDDKYVDWFNDVRKVLLDNVPGRNLLRVGLVRELIFTTGDQQATPDLPA